MSRPAGRIILAVLFALLALNAWAQVLLVPFGVTDDPPLLVVLQFLVGLTGAAAAWGSWTGARWGTTAAALHGVVTAGMLASLAPILGLPPDARGGLWAGAATALLGNLAAAWYLRRAHARAGMRD